MSEVWHHFQLSENRSSVSCTHCNKIMKRTDSSTKSMWSHLKSFHNEAVGERCFSLKRKRCTRQVKEGGSNTPHPSHDPNLVFPSFFYPPTLNTDKVFHC